MSIESFNDCVTILDSKRISRFKFHLPGANPTTVSYNAGFVKIYNATTSSLVCFEIKNSFPETI
jgi:hypothetical protein